MEAELGTQRKPYDDMEEWIRTMYPEILRYCLFHCVNRSEAEDATQDTFLKAVRYGERIKQLENQKAFVYKIARNTCIDFARRKREAMLPEELETEDAGLRNAEASADLILLLSCLSSEQRELILLRYQQDLTMLEIAQILDVPLRTVQSRLRTARKKLEHMLRKEACNHDK